MRNSYFSCRRIPNWVLLDSWKWVNLVSNIYRLILLYQLSLSATWPANIVKKTVHQTVGTLLKLKWGTRWITEVQDSIWTKIGLAQLSGYRKPVIAGIMRSNRMGIPYKLKSCWLRGIWQYSLTRSIRPIVIGAIWNQTNYVCYPAFKNTLKFHSTSISWKFSNIDFCNRNQCGIYIVNYMLIDNMADD